MRSKIIGSIVGMLLLINTIVPIHATENTLSFYSKDSNLYYNTSLFDDNTFMHHDSIYFGEKYIDSMDIINHTDTIYTLYLKAFPVEQSAEADILLENLSIEIYLDDRLVYNSDSISTDMYISLGDIKPNKDYTLSTVVKLNNKYSITDSISTEIVWKFFASNDDSIIPIESDTYKTGVKLNDYIIYICLICVFIILSNSIYTIKKYKD